MLRQSWLGDMSTPAPEDAPLDVNRENVKSWLRGTRKLLSTDCTRHSD